MRSAQDPEAGWARLWKRISIVAAAATLGGVVLIVGILIGAFVVVDQRATQAFKVEPRIGHGAGKQRSSPSLSATAPAPTKTVGSAASPPTASPVAPPAIAGEAAPAPDAQENPTDSPRHGRKRHGRRFARSHSRGHVFGFFAGRW